VVLQQSKGETKTSEHVGLVSYMQKHLFGSPTFKTYSKTKHFQLTETLVFQSELFTMATLRSWFKIPSGSHFSLANIPFGIVSTASSPKPRVAVAIGDHALDLEAFAAHDGFSALSTIQPFQSVFSEPTLNAFAALGRPIHSVVRKYIQTVLSEDTIHPGVLKDNAGATKAVFIPLKDVTNHIPFKIGDYTDFYVGLNHAVNCSRILRGIGGLQPNYKQLPVGYHGRASSVVVSGTPIRRPSGQILENPQATKPIFSACRRLDFELELGCFVCKPNEMGEPVLIDKADENLFGVVLMNDWSARDIQSWEMVPLGPFNAKNFGTSISAWVVTIEALEPFLAEGIENDQEILPYLREQKKETVYDIKLSVDLTSKWLGNHVLNSLTFFLSSKIWEIENHLQNKRQKSSVLLPADARASHCRRLPFQCWRSHGFRHYIW
jgi:fumarylacetoacetase